MPTIAFIQWITPAVLEDPQIIESLQEKQMYRSLCAHARRNGGRVVGDWLDITSSMMSDQELLLHGHHVAPPGTLAWRVEIPMELDERTG